MLLLRFSTTNRRRWPCWRTSLETALPLAQLPTLEVFQGCISGPHPNAAQAGLQAFLAAVPIIPFENQVAERCAYLRADLKNINRRVNTRALDLAIAATALVHNLVLVTRNVRDY